MTADPTAELRTLFDRWFASIPAKDSAFVDRFMASDLELVNPDGSRLDATGYKAMYDALPPGTSARYDIGEFVVRPLADGAVALISGTYHGRITLGDVVLSDKDVRFTSVWDRHGDGWRMRLHHVTPRPVMSPHAATDRSSIHTRRSSSIAEKI